MLSGIYTITNLLSSKRYVGSSVNVEKRLKTHLRLLRSKKHPNRFLQFSFSKHGEENFEFKKLENCPIEDLLKTEEKFIHAFDTLNRQKGYNLAPYPTQGSRGVKWSQQSKDKLSCTLIEQYSTKARQPVNFTHSAEAKKKITDAGLGRISPNSKKVWCHQTGLEYSSIHKAAQELKLGISGVMDVISKNLKAIHGYTFEYALNSLKEIRPLFLTSRAVVCLETGVCYDSPSDAARDLGIAGGEIGRRIRKNQKIKGFTFIYESEEEDDEGRDQ